MAEKEKTAFSDAEIAGAQAGREHAQKTFSNAIVSETADLATQSYADFDAWYLTVRAESSHQTELDTATEDAARSALEAKSILATGKFPNPYLAAAEIALTPTEANKGEGEFFASRSEFTSSFQDTAREEYSELFDGRLEDEFGPDANAWQAVDDLEPRFSVDQAHSDILDRMEHEDPSSPQDEAPSQGDFDISE